MLSLFPSLLAFQLLAPFILRITLGVVLVFWSYRALKGRSKHSAFSILEGIIGILLVVGLYTQLVALIASLVFAGLIFWKIRTKAFFTDGLNYYFILFVISLSLLLSGPGFFAFDLPL